jgi:hypothetical protein
VAIARTCSCGRRITDGQVRCTRCRDRGGRPQSCTICGRRCRGPYCPDHAFLAQASRRTNAEREAAQPWRAGYRDPNYHREKAAAKRRANGHCESCGVPSGHLECHHVIPLSTARNLDELRALNHRDNFKMLCETCHGIITRRRG